MITRGRKRRLSPQDEDTNTIKPKRTRGKHKLVASSSSSSLETTPVLRSSRRTRTTPTTTTTTTANSTTPSRSNSQIDHTDSTLPRSPSNTATTLTEKKTRRKKPTSSSILKENNTTLKDNTAKTTTTVENTIPMTEPEQQPSVTRKRKRKHRKDDRPASPPPPIVLPPAPPSPLPSKPPTPIKTPRLVLSVKNKPGRPPKRVKQGRTKKNQQLQQQKQDQESFVLESLLDEASFYRTFGHKLTEMEASTIRGAPSDKDKELFIMAKSVAEAKDERRSTASPEISTPQSNAGGCGSGNNSNNGDTSVPAPPKIDKIQFGNYLIDTWYVAPYPAEYSQYPILYFCEYCLKYMNSSFVAGRHKMKCAAKHPPGDEIYRDGHISVFEVDGRKNKIYCQNLCLLGKMFIDHKTLYYDVEPFLFYIMTEVDEQGCHIVGYFSKEKRSMMNYNVSCILTLPVHQRKGYGQYLIDFSYLLTKKEESTGSPEKPLSNLGLLSYRKYWKDALFRQLQNQENPISIEDLSFRTGMTADDVISTLQLTDILKEDSKSEGYIMEIDQTTIDKHIHKVKERGLPQVDPTKLTWTPYVLSRERLVALTSAATTPTIATATFRL
ncbi:acyl-CoA N-acyltransferase [Phascolomyces articulosus]|uniref:Histone acetyltransferase n=1 Tax=Phascolomyces articulosus TaxID=60185 RepID=A0AAD5KA21_9FUNG|nr:acyl-CoA N-acyltransferase [Phascolomyces articulosus]